MNKHPCLVIDNDEDNATILNVNLMEPPKWNALLLKSTLRVLCVKGAKDVDTRRAILQLFHAIQSTHHGITSIEYQSCKIVELGHLAYWWSARTKQGYNDVDNNDQDQPDAPPMLTLKFRDCIIEICAATTLCFMLESGFIADLAFFGCIFEEGVAEIIGTGLKTNQSLKNFKFKMRNKAQRANYMDGALSMLRTNQNMVVLGLDMLNGTSFWDVYTAVEGHTALRSLQFYRAELDVANIGPIVKMCQDVKSLKNIAFQFCQVTPSGIQLLVDQLSKYIALDSLNFQYCKIIQPVGKPSLELRWRDVQVSKLSLTETKFCAQSTSTTLFDELVTNNKIQKLGLYRVLDRDNDFQGLCNMIRSENHCPSILTLQAGQYPAATIIESLQHATKLKELTIAGLDKVGMILFVQGLENMTSLRSLRLGFQNNDNHYSEEFFKSLLDSLELNTTLWSLSLRGIDSDDAMAKAYLPRIRYLLSINRVGRTSLLTADAPVGVWPRVMARCATDPDGLFFSLTGKPDILAVPSRKRSWSEL